MLCASIMEACVLLCTHTHIQCEYGNVFPGEGNPTACMPTVSNIGCGEGEVKVYDSLYRTVSTHTLHIMASLVFSSASQLVVRMVDVERQSNGSDCGVLAIAFAYDICHGDDPCTVRFDHKSIRQHLANCLEKCSLSRFPVAGKRRSSSVRQKTQTVDLHCSCRLPEEKGDKMAECDKCKTWYHQHCLVMFLTMILKSPGSAMPVPNNEY